MKRVLVTGGAGFLGSHLCERLLHDGHDVLCLDNFETGSADNVAHLFDHERFQMMEQDVASPVVPLPAVNEIFHLAGPASPSQYQQDPVRTIRTSVFGTLQMLELARRCRARLLLASSSEVYGDPELHPQSEGYWGHVNPVGPRACHDEGKRCAEALVVSYASLYGIECRIGRVFNTYGPRMQPDDGRVIPNFVLQALGGAPITVHGDGYQTRSFCYVSDTIEGLVRLMRCAIDPGPVNLGNPSEIAVRRLAEMVIDMTGSPSPIVHRPLPEDDPTRRQPDITRARLALDWVPSIDLATGLERTIAFFRDQLMAVSIPEVEEEDDEDLMPTTRMPRIDCAQN